MTDKLTRLIAELASNATREHFKSKTHLQVYKLKKQKDQIKVFVSNDECGIYQFITKGDASKGDIGHFGAYGNSNYPFGTINGYGEVDSWFKYAVMIDENNQFLPPAWWVTEIELDE